MERDRDRGERIGAESRDARGDDEKACVQPVQPLPREISQRLTRLLMNVI